MVCGLRYGNQPHEPINRIDPRAVSCTGATSAHIGRMPQWALGMT